MPFFWREKDARQNHIFLNESEKLYTYTKKIVLKIKPKIQTTPTLNVATVAIK